MKTVLFLLIVGMSCFACDRATECAAAQNPETAAANASAMDQAAGQVPLSQKDFSFGYWLQGYRKHADDPAPDILCFETGYFGFTIDLANFKKSNFGKFDDSIDYTQGLQAGAQRMGKIAPAQLVIEIEVGTKNNRHVYRATSCEVGKRTEARRLQGARLWESGQLVQHFDLQDLIFEDDAGNKLAAAGTLDIVVWPQSLTLNAELAPTFKADFRDLIRPLIDWTNATTRILLKTPLRDWKTEQNHVGKWKTNEARQLILTCDFHDKPVTDSPLHMQIRSTDDQDFPVVFELGKNCYVANVGKIKRAWKTGYTDIRNYDEFTLVVENDATESAQVPFLLDFYDVANITGVCPMLCDEEGVPTGIPVQLSKNWHYKKTGHYLRAYALLPAQPGKTIYTLRVVYGFYGTLPAASHAQLSLVGYGGNGRWDQMAIGCWGETMCLDMDMSCVDVAITDVRMLMARDGLRGKKWNWTDAGWGGDWLWVNGKPKAPDPSNDQSKDNAKDQKNQKLLFTELKTAYLAHGPCLTEARYDGYFGSQHEVDLQATVQTLRTDDYARAFHTLRYDFEQEIRADDGWLFKMGRTFNLVTPQIAYGNGNGLIIEKDVPLNLDPTKPLVDRETLQGAGPWWIAFPGAYVDDPEKHRGTGSRALIIRSYQATFNGQRFTTPTISMPVNKIRADGQLDLDLLLVPPRGVTDFKSGDWVEMELEWITVPRIADDYYGPNEDFREHLKANPRSWQTVFREAKGNALKVNVQGGTLLHNYPIIIQADQSRVEVEIEGGVGAVPLRFEGLISYTGYTLYQEVAGRLVKFDPSVHANDFWQTDYDAKSKSYKMSFNLPLDGLAKSTWVLIYDPEVSHGP